jgi:hypothetical protein
MVTFLGAKLELRQEFGEVIVGRFVEVQTGDHQTSRDQIVIGGVVLDFAEFVGASAYIGVLSPDALGTEEHKLATV